MLNCHFCSKEIDPKESIIHKINDANYKSYTICSKCYDFWLNYEEREKDV